MNVKKGDIIGNFIINNTALVGKNKVYDCICKCGNIKRFWKFSAINKQKTCGCGTDNAGFTSKQRRSIKSRMSGYINGAKKRNFSWELSYEDFCSIISKKCFYCGSDPKFWNCISNAPSLQKDSPNVNFKDYEIKFSGVDRFDSNKGYTLDNCVPCCVYCNRAKSNLSFEDFKDHIKKIYEWLFQKELKTK
jgi:hypothetical protein